MLPILQIGPLALPMPALLLLIGFWIGLDLTEKQAPRFHVESGPIYNMTLVGVVAGILGARLVYAAQSPGAFLQSPLSLLALTPQMLNATGGIAVGLLAALVYLRWKHMPLWPTLDAATTLFSVLAVVIGLANFASGDAFGTPTSVPWAVQLWGEMRHPTQVYQTLAALLIAILVWPGTRAAKYSLLRPGFRLWMFLALSAAARLVIETFRGDSVVVLNIFREAQVIAWLVLAASLWQIGRRLDPAAGKKHQALNT